MINFRNDYQTICHKEIIDALLNNLDKSYTGYGMDEECKEAKLLIRHEINNNDVDIHFIPGGTVSNKIVIAHTLKPYEAVIAATTGHINTHETGAIEETGHKVLTVKSYDGKIKPYDIIKIMDEHKDEHMVKPKMVYISNPTELGTVYNKEELENISKICCACGLYLYLDGARLSSALTSPVNDLTMKDICDLTDAFYIGGTKSGVIFGEAVVIKNKNMREDFRYSIKHFGGMIAKGFVMGIMFKTLFQNDLFYRIGKHENELALKLYNELSKLNVKFLTPFNSNQLFLVLPNEIISSLSKDIIFEVFEEGEKLSTIRLVINCNTKEDEIIKAIEIFKERLKG